MLNNLRELHIEDSPLAPKPLRRLLRSLRKMMTLKTLRLVNLVELENFMECLTDSIKKHRTLKVLDIR